MIAAVIRFVVPAGIDMERMREMAPQRASTYYLHIPGLRTKTFIISPEQRIYGGLYVWESRKALDEFLQSEVYVRGVQQLGQPDIQIYDVAAYIEQGVVVNSPGEVKTDMKIPSFPDAS